MDAIFLVGYHDGDDACGGFNIVAAMTDQAAVHTGPGIVDGVSMYGHLPNRTGSVISIDRSLVNPDRSKGCSHGLHVGTFEYASDFASRLPTVAVNPRDVVSVPSDFAYAKIRVCRYHVIELAPSRAYTETSFAEACDCGDPDCDFDCDSLCDECGGTDRWCSHR